MKEYKDYVDKQHVTEPMIADIMKRIREEEKKEQMASVNEYTKQQEKILEFSDKKQNRGRRIRNIAIGAGTLVAAAGLVIGVSKIISGGSQLVYTTVDTTMFRSNEEMQTGMSGNTEQENSVEMELGEYQSYTDIDFTNLFGANGLESVQILVQQDGEQIVEDKGTFYYKVDGIEAVIHTSKTKELLPKELDNAAISKWKDTEVIVCKDSQENNFEAYFEKKGVKFSIKCLGVEQNEFEKILKKIL